MAAPGEGVSSTPRDDKGTRYSARRQQGSSGSYAAARAPILKPPGFPGWLSLPGPARLKVTLAAALPSAARPPAGPRHRGPDWGTRGVWDTGAAADGMGSGERHGGLTEPSRHHGGASPLSPAAGALSSSLPWAGGGGRPARYWARAVSPRFRHARGQLPAENWEPEPDLPLSAPPPAPPSPRGTPHSPGPRQPR